MNQTCRRSDANSPHCRQCSKLVTYRRYRHSVNQGRPLNVINEAARFIEKTGGEVKKGTDQVKQGGKR